jgi:hypothetical protein
MFPKDIVLGDKEGPERHQCCKVCVRKMFMKDFFDEYLLDYEEVYV